MWKWLALLIALYVVPARADVINGRTYDVRCPAVGCSSGMKMVFGFHGKGQTPAGFEAASRIQDYTDAIVVYPRGTWLNWDDDAEAGPDLAFIDAIIQLYDPSEVYAFGLSNGGRFSWSLACDYGIDGATTVSGTLTDYTCNPSNPPRVLVISGTRDWISPWNGGGIGTGVSFPDSIARYEAAGGTVTVERPVQGHVWTLANTQSAVTFFGLQ